MVDGYTDLLFDGTISSLVLSLNPFYINFWGFGSGFGSANTSWRIKIMLEDYNNAGGL